MMNAQKYALALLALAGGLSSFFNETWAEITSGESTILSATSQMKQGGLVAQQTTYLITNSTHGIQIKVTCDHRGTGDSSIWVRSLSMAAASDRATVGTALAEAVLLAKNATESGGTTVGNVLLPYSNISTNSSVGFYGRVAEQMRQLDSVVEKFNDQRLQEIVRFALEGDELAGAFKARLESAGFTVTLKPPTMVAIRPSLVGRPWKNVADEIDAGLQPASAACVVEMHR